MNNKDELMHFGVKGMRWGVRNRKNGVNYMSNYYPEQQGTRTTASVSKNINKKYSKYSDKRLKKIEKLAEKDAITNNQRKHDKYAKKAMGYLMDIDPDMPQRYVPKAMTIGSGIGGFVGGPIGAGIGASIGAIVNPPKIIIPDKFMNKSTRAHAQKNWAKAGNFINQIYTSKTTNIDFSDQIKSYISDQLQSSHKTKTKKTNDVYDPRWKEIAKVYNK